MQKEADVQCQQAAFDNITNNLGREIVRYAIITKQLIGTLTLPKDLKEPDIPKRQENQLTIQEVLSELTAMLSGTNDQLDSIVEKLKEQIGSLKILP